MWLLARSTGPDLPKLFGGARRKICEMHRARPGTVASVSRSIHFRSTANITAIDARSETWSNATLAQGGPPGQLSSRNCQRVRSNSGCPITASRIFSFRASQSRQRLRRPIIASAISFWRTRRRGDRSRRFSLFRQRRRHKTNRRSPGPESSLVDSVITRQPKQVLHGHQSCPIQSRQVGDRETNSPARMHRSTLRRAGMPKKMRDSLERELGQIISRDRADNSQALRA